LTPTLLPDFHRSNVINYILTFDLKESMRKSKESEDILGVKDIAFINSTIVFSFKHLF